MAVQNEEIVHYQYSITAENLILEILFEKIVSRNMEVATLVALIYTDNLEIVVRI